MSFLHGRLQGMRTLSALASVLAVLAVYHVTAWFHPSVPLAHRFTWNHDGINPSQLATLCPLTSTS